MIIISGRRLLIPAAERHIGFTHDHLVEKRLFSISDPELFGMEYRADIENTGESVVLEKELDQSKGTLILRWDITSGVVESTPIVKFQLRGFEAEGERVWHSEKSSFLVSDSVEAGKDVTDEELGEFQILEKQAASHCSKAKEYAEACQLIEQETKALHDETQEIKAEVLEIQSSTAEIRDIAQSHAASALENAEKTLAYYNQIKDTTYTKEETDSLLDAKPDITDISDLQENIITLHNKLVSGLNKKANSSDVYSKNETDSLLDAKSNITDISDLQENIITLHNKLVSGLNKKANSSDVYTKDVIAGVYTEQVERVSIVGITTYEDTENAGVYEITEDTISAYHNPSMPEPLIAHISYSGNAKLVMTPSDSADKVYINGQELTRNNDGKLYYDGYITDGITIEITSDVFTFDTFTGEKNVSTDGYMSGEQAQTLFSLCREEKVFLTGKNVTATDGSDGHDEPTFGLDYVSAYSGNFDITETGNIKLKCSSDNTDGVTTITINGTTTPLVDDFEFSGEVDDDGISVHCAMSMVTFTEFTKEAGSVRELQDKIGSIDTALDELHNYAEALKSGGEA